MTGGSAITVAVGAEVIIEVPSVAVAVSITSMVWPTSAGVRVYVAPSCGLIVEHVVPAHDSHASESVTAVASDQAPGVSVRIWPCWATPTRTGGALLTGAAMAVPVAAHHIAAVNKTQRSGLSLS